jgi:hypothetical protein
VFPGRSVNSVNAQWQRFCHYITVEEAVRKAVQIGMPYSTMYPIATYNEETQQFTFSAIQGGLNGVSELMLNFIDDGQE